MQSSGRLLYTELAVALLLIATITIDVKERGQAQDPKIFRKYGHASEGLGGFAYMAQPTRYGRFAQGGRNTAAEAPRNLAWLIPRAAVDCVVPYF